MEDRRLGISFGSINTGLPKDIVEQIIAAERIPVQKMEARKAKENDKKVLVQELTKLVEDLRGVLTANLNDRALRDFSVTTREDLIGVNVDKNVAQPGEYQLEVLQLAQKSSAQSSGFDDPNSTYTGVGFVQYNLPNGENREIYVDANHASLNGMAE